MSIAKLKPYDLIELVTGKVKDYGIVCFTGRNFSGIFWITAAASGGNFTRSVNFSIIDHFKVVGNVQESFLSYDDMIRNHRQAELLKEQLAETGKVEEPAQKHHFATGEKEPLSPSVVGRRFSVHGTETHRLPVSFVTVEESALTPPLKPVPEKYSARGGLLYDGELMIASPEADYVAQEYGFTYAERFVKYLEERQNGNSSEIS